MSKIGVLIVDDSVTIRAMIEALFERDPDLSILGVARDADEAGRMIEDLKPAVVTVDVAMPGRDGMELLDEIVARGSLPVVMLSSLMREGDPLVEEAMKRGASACFNKSRMIQDADRLVAVIKKAAEEGRQAAAGRSGTGLSTI